MIKVIAGLSIIITQVIMWFSGLWAAVSFLIYLFKDKEFDFNSLWCFGICLVIYLIAVTIIVFSTKEELPKRENLKSRFQERLGKIQKERESKNG